MDLTKNKTSSEHARVACSLGFCRGALHSLASARVCLCWLLRAFSDGASSELSRS